jgi:hypothetical protein
VIFVVSLTWRAAAWPAALSRSNAPHRPPSRLPPGEMAVYAFTKDGVKAGKAGPNSEVSAQTTGQTRAVTTTSACAAPGRRTGSAHAVLLILNLVRPAQPPFAPEET